MTATRSGWYEPLPITLIVNIQSDEPKRVVKAIFSLLDQARQK